MSFIVNWLYNAENVFFSNRELLKLQSIQHMWENFKCKAYY